MKDWPSRPLRALAQVDLGRQRSPEHADGPHVVPYLRAANVIDGELDLSDVKEMNFTPCEQEFFSLRKGDILVTEGSGSLRTVGASAVWRNELPGTVCFQNTLLRIRPRSCETDPKFLEWWCRFAYADGLFANISAGANIFHLSVERVRALPIRCPRRPEQKIISDFLDGETARIDALIAKKRRLVALSEERIENLIQRRIADIKLVNSKSIDAVTLIKKVLKKAERPAVRQSEMVTAFRDGQVTARSLRRADGYTLSWAENSQLQGVCKDDIVIHGLDGFAGAIGVSEIDGVCSPVYHVCTPKGAGDPVYLGRLLRILAVSGYLGLFASSTRERAVDFRNWDLLGRIPIPNVHPSEQWEIGVSIRRIVPLKLIVERSAELAREYRQALITAAVTGEMDVPGVST